MASRRVSVLLVVALLGQALSAPLDVIRLPRGFADNELDSKENAVSGPKDSIAAASDRRPTRDDDFDEDNDDRPSKVSLDSTTEKVEYATPVFDDDDSDEDDDFEPMNTAPTGGGSNIFSLLRLANAIFPSSSGANPLISNIIRGYFNYLPYQNLYQNYNPTGFLRRSDVTDNLIDIDDIKDFKPPSLQRLETEESTDEDEDDDESHSVESDENNAAEESIEAANNGNGNGNVNGNGSDKKESEGSEGNDSEDDYSDEPPEGDGGGILGILAGLSGGEDGSDLGTLLATIGGIVANLSGDGVDINALIASGLGLFVGLLSEGEENPGSIIASYLLTSLDTLTGGGSKNNGAFFGKFLAKLITGTSAGGDPDASSEEGKEPEKDSAGFFGSFLMGLLGDMSKGSSSGSSSSSSSSHPAEERSIQLSWI